MGTVTEHVDVAVPVRTAYNQWTQFEEFPRFMEGVTEVRQVSDTMTHWTTEIGGVKREFDARITEQLPDERVAWRNTEGKDNADIAGVLFISPKTVKNHISNILMKLQMDNRIQAAVFAVRRGLA